MPPKAFKGKLPSHEHKLIEGFLQRIQERTLPEIVNMLPQGPLYKYTKLRTNQFN